MINLDLAREKWKKIKMIWLNCKQVNHGTSTENGVNLDILWYNSSIKFSADVRSHAKAKWKTRRKKCSRNNWTNWNFAWLKLSSSDFIEQRTYKPRVLVTLIWLHKTEQKKVTETMFGFGRSHFQHFSVRCSNCISTTHFVTWQKWISY